MQEIEHYENVITGNEITHLFSQQCQSACGLPEINQKQFDEIQEIRQDIFDLVRYLNQQDIYHFVAHPLHKVNGRLQWHHLSSYCCCLEHVEVLNGTRLKRLNDIVAQVVQSLTREDIERLAEKYNIDPVGERPGKNTWLQERMTIADYLSEPVTLKLRWRITRKRRCFRIAAGKTRIVEAVTDRLRWRIRLTALLFSTIAARLDRIPVICFICSTGSSNAIAPCRLVLPINP